MKIIVFAGTGDGRELSIYLASIGADVTVSVATAYGAELIKDENIYVHCGRLDSDEMRGFINGSDVVIDATHPYADKATENILAACRSEGIEYIRLSRSESCCKDAVYAESVEEAVKYLTDTDGDIFVSTGSSELSAFENIGSRVTARVLDTEKVRQKCERMNIKKIIYKKPPFDLNDNIEDMNGCRFLVTKDGGETGGMPEKLKAAELLSMSVVVISRPDAGNTGYSLDEIKAMFRSKLIAGE